MQRRWRWLLGLFSLVLFWHALWNMAWVDVWHLLAGISPLSTASTSVVVDRLLEFLASFIVLMFCLLGLGLTTKYLTCPGKISIINPESSGTITNDSLK